MTFRNKGFGEMPSSRLDSHRNSVQDGMVERFIAFMATIFVPNFNSYAAATFCPLDGNGNKEQKTKKLRKAVQDMSSTLFLMRSSAGIARGSNGA